MRNETQTPDITVIGGGLAGCCAAIAAARLGHRVALVNNRPVLGGNSSSEVRVWVVGATGHGWNRFAREGGIMGELFVENQYRNPDGNPYIWDAVVLDAVLAEPNITVYLNTDVREVEAEGPEDDRRITAVTGWTMGSERLIRFQSAVYLDCTGDGLVGFLAGARHRIGREAKSEHGEPWAPDIADDITLGSTLLFYTKDAGHPVRYVPPAFAKDITATSIPERRVIKAGDNGCAYWWIEFGGELDTVHDNERIRDELRSVIYGIWDHIKNSGEFDAETMTLEWVGAVPGKREYRRFLGDYVLTQHDILEQTPFEDRVAFGGWSIDLHPPQGMYAAEDGAKQRYADGVYHIPFRSLYSVNTGNLLMAGRNISASHVAFGSTRVMATCATLGEAAGTAAALCVRRGVRPREVDVAELQRTLLRQDASVIGLPLDDPEDLAARARVEASGWLADLSVGEPAAADGSDSSDTWPLAADAGLVLPVDPVLNGLRLLVTATAPTTLRVAAYDPGPGQNYLPRHRVAESETAVPVGERQWIDVGLAWTPETARNVFLRISADPALTLHTGPALPGTVAFTKVPLQDKHERPQQLREWSAFPLARRVFRVQAGPTSAYEPAKAVDGYLRPFAGPHQWLSAPLDSGPAWLALRWPDPVTIRRIEVLGDDEPNEDLINLHHHRTDFELPPNLVRAYRVEIDGRPVAAVADNRRRRRVHELAEPVTGRELRVVVEASWGSPTAHLVAVRAYG